MDPKKVYRACVWFQNTDIDEADFLSCHAKDMESLNNKIDDELRHIREVFEMEPLFVEVERPEDSGFRIVRDFL